MKVRSIKSFLILTCVFTLIVGLLGCTKGGSDGQSELSSGDSSSVGSLSCEGGELCSVCGSWVDNLLINNIDPATAELVNVEAIDADLVSITRLTGLEAGNKTLVKLQGLTADGVSVVKRERARDTIDENGFNALFVDGGSNCSIVLPDGGKGVVGQIFTSSGTNLGELLIQKGFALPDAADSCGGQALAGCLSGLEVEEEFSNSVVTKFLWKPISESDGRLAIHSSPFNTTVRVTGALSETRPSVGPGNGFGSLSRFSKPGCSYGNSVKVEFFDNMERRIKINNGDNFITVPSGCSRFEQDY